MDGPQPHTHTRRDDSDRQRWEYFDGSCNSEWQTFANTTSQKIESAFLSSSKNVTVDNPSGGTMEIDFATMQSSTPSSIKIRRVSRKTNPDAIYEWRDDGDRWKPYDTSACEMLRIAQSVGRSHVTLFVGSNLAYLVDFATMNQTNGRTGFRRRLRAQLRGIRVMH